MPALTATTIARTGAPEAPAMDLATEAKFLCDAGVVDHDGHMNAVSPFIPARTAGRSYPSRP